MSLTGCATVQAPQRQFLRDCTLTYLPAGGKPTQASLYKLAIDREADLRNCNADKRAIRAWYETYCDAKGPGCKVKYGSEK
uniref:O-spanin n=1 Tax=Xanthomonas phage MK21 TaxID=3148942 RepID=A0AAU7J8U4_9CAUD